MSNSSGTILRSGRRVADRTSSVSENNSLPISVSTQDSSIRHSSGEPTLLSNSATTQDVRVVGEQFQGASPARQFPPSAHPSSVASEIPVASQSQLSHGNTSREHSSSVASEISVTSRSQFLNVSDTRQQPQIAPNISVASHSQFSGSDNRQQSEIFRPAVNQHFDTLRFHSNGPGLHNVGQSVPAQFYSGGTTGFGNIGQFTPAQQFYSGGTGFGNIGQFTPAQQFYSGGTGFGKTGQFAPTQQFDSGGSQAVSHQGFGSYNHLPSPSLGLPAQSHSQYNRNVTNQHQLVQPVLAHGFGNQPKLSAHEFGDDYLQRSLVNDVKKMIQHIKLPMLTDFDKWDQSLRLSLNEYDLDFLLDNPPGTAFPHNHVLCAIQSSDVNLISRRLKAHIFSSLSDDQKGLVSPNQTLSDLYQSLRNFFYGQTPSRNRLQELLQRLYSLKFERDARTFGMALIGLWRSVERADPVFASQHTHMVLRCFYDGLPPTYDAGFYPHHANIFDAIQHASDIEERNRRRGVTDSTPPLTSATAFAASTRPCPRCRVSGHHVADCPAAAPVPVTCIRCNEVGHYARDCPAPTPAPKATRRSASTRRGAGAHIAEVSILTEEAEYPFLSDEEADALMVTAASVPSTVSDITDTKTVPTAQSNTVSSNITDAAVSDVVQPHALDGAAAVFDAVSPLSAVHAFTAVSSTDDLLVYLDSCCTHSMTPWRSLLSNVQPLDRFVLINVANKQSMTCTHAGDMMIPIGGTDGEHLFLRRVLFVADLSKTLISTRSLANIHGVSTCFSPGDIVELRRSDTVLLSGSYHDGLPCLRLSPAASASANLADVPIINSYDRWHNRLGHIHAARLSKITSTMTSGVKITKSDFASRSLCSDCVLSKSTVKPLLTHPPSKPAQGPFDRLHSDRVEMSVFSLKGERYATVFLDDASLLIFAYFSAGKRTLPEMVNKAIVLGNTHFKRDVMYLRADNEYTSNAIKSLLDRVGAILELCVPHEHGQNGKAERIIRTLCEMMLAMLHHSGLPLCFWTFAFQYSIFILNRIPHGTKSMSAVEELFGSAPDLSFLRVFGCVCWAHVPKDVRAHKLVPKARQAIHLGRSQHHKAYVLLMLDTKRIVHRRSVVFDERSLFRDVQVDQSAFPVRLVPRPSKNLPATSSFLDIEKPDASCNITVTALHALHAVPGPVPAASALVTMKLVTPNTYRQAMQSPQRDQWLRAMRSELYSLIENGVYKLVPAPPGVRPLRSKWVFKIKRREDGKIDRFKCRVVACGYSQRAGVDYFDTFAPVIRYESFRVLLAYAAHLGVRMHSLDVSTAFLNGDLEEDVYMLPPSGAETLFEDKFDVADSLNDSSDHSAGTTNGAAVLSSHAVTTDAAATLVGPALGSFHDNSDMRKLSNAEIALMVRQHPTLAWHLLKGLYGLKQSPRQWHKALLKALQSLQFKACLSEPCVFVRTLTDGSLFLLGVYVDDMQMVCKDDELVASVKQSISTIFKCRDEGVATWVLQMRITYAADGIYLDQSQSIDAMLERFGMTDCNPAPTPMEVNAPLSKSQVPTTDPGRAAVKDIPYRQAIGSLLHLARSTRPDIVYAVNRLSRFNSGWGKPHWTAVQRVFRYLKGTRNLGIFFRQDCSMQLSAFVDAAYADCPDTRRSTYGFVTLLQGAPISWTSKLPAARTPACSTAEAEYVGMYFLCRELKWLRQFLNELGLPQQPTPVYEDNNACIRISKGEGLHQRTKHLDVKFHFVRTCVTVSDVSIQHVSTQDQLADIFTKPLPCPQFLKLRSLLVTPVPS